MAEASWLVPPRHVPAQTDPAESCQQYAAQNPQITMGPINNHIVSSYLISYRECGRTKCPSEIYSRLFLAMTKLYLNTVNFVFSFPLNVTIWDFFLMMRKLDHSFTLLLIHYYGLMCKKYIIMGPLRDGHEIWMSLSWWSTPWNKT